MCATAVFFPFASLMPNGGAPVTVSDYEDDEDMEYDDDPDYDGPMDGTSVLYSELLLLCRVAFTVMVSSGISRIQGNVVVGGTCVRFTVFTYKRGVSVRTQYCGPSTYNCRLVIFICVHS
jgi:hypothetical protein